MAETGQFNYHFPHFDLHILHNEHQLLSAEFALPSDDLLLLNAAQDGLSQHILVELDAYVANPCHVFNLPFSYSGTQHQLRVWEVMQRIPSGSVLSYSAVAAQLNSAPRAVGGACGRNPLPVFIPCHRIIAANQQLGGFNSGKLFFNLGIKRWLLEHEGIFLKTR